ncbi:uncharacterized protein LOC131206566 [Anopheles bellator]|uniref:uncharacterized protein LOC131206566 n=1 Tax=Anopheles bellator TaxID=139047 RepID=UPI00264858CB|nr:uncharacterized protein LOC131206566 [Anopheles bellator]
MPFNCSRDCVGIRYRINSLHQTWKWLHQTIALHEYLISMSAEDTNAIEHHRLHKTIAIPQQLIAVC